MTTIHADEWIVWWSAPYSLFLATEASLHYKEAPAMVCGAGFSKSITVYEDGMSSCRLPQEDMRAFEAACRARVRSEPEVVERWSAALVHVGEKLVEQASEDLLKKDTLKRFKELHAKYMGYQNANKGLGAVVRDDVQFQVLQEARKVTEDVFPKIDAACGRIFAQISAKHKYLVEDIHALTTDELDAYVSTGTLPKVDVLRSRRKGCVVFADNDRVERMVPLDTVTIVSSNEVRGQTAFRGKTRGSVRVMRSEQDPFNQGEILVTGMTLPEMVPKIKNARAIITDGGGMLCHAAVVAREFRIPCVIATGNATQVLRTGDLVEVDADKGVVRRV